ncbi:alpha/beta hydrolase-fold protein [Aquipuribacter sp. MA13-6]|uniref:alpha/beta hydrolase n=1 Tax=unclassified Aquipuribacter TaxID=2635084 RepID=UPI003EEE87C9
MSRPNPPRPWRRAAMVTAVLVAASTAAALPSAAGATPPPAGVAAQTAAPPTVAVDLERDDWRFTLGDDAAWAEPGFDDSGWATTSVPNDGAPFASYDGFGWFRLTFDLPADAEGANLVASLGFIDDVDEAYLNGRRIGGSGVMPPNANSQWFERRLYSVPGDVPVFGGENVLAVRVYDMSGGGGWYSGPVGIYSKDAVRANVYGITGAPAPAEQSAAVAEVLAVQAAALAAGDVDAYLATLDPSYFHDGRTPERRERELREWLADSGTLRLTDSEVEVVVAEDGALVVDTNRRVTGTKDGVPFEFQPTEQEFLRFSPTTFTETGNESRFFRETVDSELEGAPRELVTYLPPSYLTEPDRRFPVVYLLHGINGGSREWEPREMDAVLDELWADGLAESIVVMPDGESLWYLDQPVPWRSMFLQEMVPMVDAEYRTLAQREFRALTGISMGGFGAFSIGLDNPGTFSSLASHIGSLGYTPSGPTPIARARTMSAEELGRFSLYFDACEFDEYGFDNGVRQLSTILTGKGVEHTSQVYPQGRHNDACWLPQVGRSFGSHSDAFRAAGLQEDWVGPSLDVSASPEQVWSSNGGMSTVVVEATATDPSGVAAVTFVEARAEGPSRAVVVRRGDGTFSVRAVPGARYTFVHEATDGLGNTSTGSVTVVVQPTTGVGRR